MRLTKRFNLDLTRDRSLALIKAKDRNSWLWRFPQTGKQFHSTQKKWVQKSYKMRKQSITLMVLSQRSKRKKLKKPCSFKCGCKKSRWENKYFNNSCLPFSNRITSWVLIKLPHISKIPMATICQLLSISTPCKLSRHTQMYFQQQSRSLPKLHKAITAKKTNLDTEISSQLYSRMIRTTSKFKTQPCATQCFRTTTASCIPALNSHTKTEHAC